MQETRKSLRIPTFLCLSKARENSNLSNMCFEQGFPVTARVRISLRHCVVSPIAPLVMLHFTLYHSTKCHRRDIVTPVHYRLAESPSALLRSSFSIVYVRCKNPEFDPAGSPGSPRRRELGDYPHTC